MKSLILALATGASLAAMLPTAAAAQNYPAATPTYDNGGNRSDDQRARDEQRARDDQRGRGDQYNQGGDPRDQYRDGRDQHVDDRDQYRDGRDQRAGDRYYRDYDHGQFANLDRDQRQLLRDLDQRYAGIDHMIDQGARSGRLAPNQVRGFRAELDQIRQRLTWKVTRQHLKPRWAIADTDNFARRVARSSGLHSDGYADRRW